MREQRKILLMMETSRAYGRSILRGIAKYSRAHGPWVFYRQAPFYWGTAGRRAPCHSSSSWVQTERSFGSRSKREEIEEVLATGLPVIVSPYTEPFPGVPNIVSDDQAIGRMAAEYLLHRGFRQFAYCGFGDMYFWSRERGKGFCLRVREAGYEPHYYELEQRTSASRRSWEREQGVLVDWLEVPAEARWPDGVQ